MNLNIGDKITSVSIQGDDITGDVTSILENTVILFCGLNNYVVSKKNLKKQGYKFTKVGKGVKSIFISSNRNLKK